MTQQHPITPPPELVQQWTHEWNTLGARHPAATNTASYIATRAAQWGADHELQACCEWLEDVSCDDPQDTAKTLRAARRPKPQSLNSIALQMLGTIERDQRYLPEITDTIRRALEQLPDS